jgi:pyoverdine/dityrosine biosynthesis protein Dit1
MMTNAALSRPPDGDDVARAIETLLLSISNFEGAEASGTSLASVHATKIRAAIDRHGPLQLILPAFPAKAANREKTIGDLPDFGEALALWRLERLCADIQQVHAPGATVVVCSDGRVFNDLVGVTDDNVSAYATALKQMVRELGFGSIAFFDLDGAMPRLPFAEMRGALVATFGDSLEHLRARARDDERTKRLFNGIHRFVFEDRLVQAPHKSRNQLRTESRALAYQVVQRSNAWSRLVETRFPDAIRLSIHPQLAGAHKIGIRMIEAESRWATPWHNVALLQDGRFRLVKQAEAIAAGARLHYWEDKYAYYAA